MDQMAALPPGSLAARMAQARAQRQRDTEAQATGGRRQATEDAAAQALSPVDYRLSPEEVTMAATPDAPGIPLVGGMAQETAPGGDVPDADELAALRRTFVPSDEAADAESDAALAVAPGPAPADELRLARAEIAQLHVQAQRAQEELAGIRRRGERDREELGHAARSDAIVQMLPIVDDLERALAHVPATLRNDPWVAGILMIGDGLQRALERQGVQRIAPCHAPFDPHLHEAVAHLEATDVAEDTVIQVYRTGYAYQGRVLRAAQVQVAVKKEQ